LFEMVADQIDSSIEGCRENIDGRVGCWVASGGRNDNARGVRFLELQRSPGALRLAPRPHASRGGLGGAAPLPPS
jgi:hypothetical protein